jgi:sigma-B regulation protein RsbU (phosphoserine phosphatase)
VVAQADLNQSRILTSDGVEWAIRSVLVVDDSRAQRILLSRALTKQGFDVTEAGSGDEALALCREASFDMVLSDWMMPGMDGPELCRQFRQLERENYGYFILMTSKSEKGVVAEGLDAGADDFLNKPVNLDELRARINAGDRVLRMQRELKDKNKLVTATLAELQAVYDSLDRDLVDARKMQLSLVREPYRDFGAADVSLLLKPSGHVGGDLVGFFNAGRNKIAAYSIDVSGHGVASALLTARLASYLSEGSPEQNIALVRDTDDSYVSRPPHEVATLLNMLMIEDMDTDLYFTTLFGYLDLATGQFDYTQCGHPNPSLIKASGEVSFFGDGGLPIGLLEDADFTQNTIHLDPGDRLLLYSDGFTECENDDGEMLEEEGFHKLIFEHTDLTGTDFFDALVWNLDLFSGNLDFGDDLSCTLVSYTGNRPSNT